MKPSRIVSAFLIMLALCAAAFAQKVASGRATVAVDVERLHAEIDQLGARIQQKEAELLEAPAEDKRAFAGFLTRPGTGLVRLLPRGAYDLFVDGDGAYYSFSRRSHEYGRGSDIQFDGGGFSVGFAGADFGLFVSLGGVTLEDVTTETPGVGPLAEFDAPADTSKAREQYARSMTGFEVDGLAYRREAALAVENTYVVRSVNYGESDVLAAFRVVRKDSDGSVVLLWKMLKEFPKPELLRMERDAGACQ
jgi:hypothetical protein